MHALHPLTPFLLFVPSHAAGRLLLFSSGQENVHVVHRVSYGVRYVFSMWFTCDREKEFAEGRVWDSTSEQGKEEL